MAAGVLEKIQELLNEEKWTRATIENYTRKNFVVLDKIIEQAFKEELVDELKQECREHLKHAANSVIALYILGIINYEKKSLDNNDLPRAIALFRDNRKWSIVEFLAERVLSYEENKRALKVLGAVFQHTGREDELWSVWERLIKVDHSNVEVAHKIAAHNEDKNHELSIYYYKLTIKRMLMLNDMSQFGAVWKKLTELIPEDLEFFYSLENKLKSKLSEDDVAAAYSELLTHYEGQDVDTIIRLLETIITYNPKSKEPREQLINAFKTKYASHSMIETALTLASIDQAWKPLKESLDAFNSTIAFDTEDYVQHRSWGIGKIQGIEGNVLIIDFNTSKNHKMDLEMGLKALKKLEIEHLSIISLEKKDEVIRLAKDEIKDFLTIVFNSFGKDTESGKELLLKDMKEVIISCGAINASQWTSWWTKAKKVFKQDPKFGASREKKNTYFLRNKPMSLEEDIMQRFELSKTFKEKISLFQDFITHSAEFESDAFIAMVDYFLKKAAESEKAEPDGDIIESVILLDRLKKQLGSIPAGKSGLKLPDLTKIYDKIANPAKILTQIDENENRKAFYQLIRRHDANWPQVLGQILQATPTPLHLRALDDLILNEQHETVRDFCTRVLNHYREDLDHLVWMAKLYYDRKDREDALELDEFSLVIALINSLPAILTQIENKTNVAENRKRFATISDILFKDHQLTTFLTAASKENAEKLLQLLPHINNQIDDATKTELSTAVNTALPERNFSFAKAKSDDNELHPFLTTEQSYNKKQEEFKHIVEVEIPENSNDIALAVQQGDLSENAEYKAALEHQEQLKAKVSQLDGELKKAKIVSDHEVTLDQVGFGNKVRMLNLNTKQEEEYTLLGEWDSDPDNFVLSYKSPLGKAMLFKSVDNTVEFHLQEKTHKYKVLNISKADMYAN